MKFLQKVASDIYGHYNGQLRDLTIVFPGKRAKLFFNEYLSDLADRPIWSPTYKTLKELYNDLSELEEADPLLLIYHLYASYVEVVNEMQSHIPEEGTRSTEESEEGERIPFTPHPLDEFYSWGEVMLNDFDDIDKNLSHAKDIFRNLEDLDELTSLDYLSHAQQKAIERYFGAFDKDSKTKLKEKFLTMWNMLYPIYLRFRQRLKSNGIAYEGMLCRDVVEHNLSDERFKSKKYIFVGFNVLTSTDQRLLTYLKNSGKALFYWDYDNTYLHSDENGISNYEAGRYIKHDIAQFGNNLNADNGCYDNMRNPKDITYISSPTDNSQVRYAQEWIKENVSSEGQMNETAIVLCNPSMLQTMIHSIPESADDENPYKINVTMGFPMSSTPVYSFIMSLLDLQIFGERGKRMWGHSYVTKILRHPYCSRMVGELATIKYREIHRNNILFVSEDLFSEDDTLTLIFTKQQSTNDLLVYLSDITRRLGASLFKNTPSDSTQLFDEQLYKESVYNSFAIVNRIRSIFETVATSDEFSMIRNNEMSKERLMRLVNEVMRRQSIPFHGEPLEGIQILSLMDTRNIDFKNVIMLGVNDDNIPSNLQQASFIPYTLREAHGMTTVEARSSLYAYSFYRLIQRADKIAMLYNDSTDGVGSGDMSRYMTQLLVEQDVMLDKESRIKHKVLESAVAITPIHPIKVSKNDKILSILKQRYNVVDENGNIIDANAKKKKYFSPSALNTYLNCPFSFYLHYVASLKAEDDLTDEVGNDVFGTIFHDCMESIYSSHVGKILESKQLLAWSRDEDMLRREVDKGFKKNFFKINEDVDIVSLYNGEQWLNREVIVSYVKKQLEYDSHLCPLRIEGLEDKSHEMFLTINDMTIRLGGIIDRIDTIHVGDPLRERHRIVDYKTSATGQSANDISKLFDRTKGHRPYHIFQTFYYCDIYTEHCKKAVAPSLMYIKPASKDNDPSKEEPSIIKLGEQKNKYYITDFATQAKEEFHGELVKLTNEILDKTIPFVQSTNEDSCKWCDYKEICGRKIIEKND